MADQTVRVTARGDFTQLQRGLKQLQGDLKNVTGEIDRGARKGGFFDDSQIRALDFFGKRFKSTLQELKDAMAEHGHAFERLLSMARNAHGAEKDAIQKEINYRSKIIDQLEEQISHMEKLYQQRKKDATDFGRPNGGSGTKGGKADKKDGTSGNHDLGGTVLNKVLGGAQLMLGMAGIGGVMSMVTEAYRLAYERNTAPLDLSQRIRGYGGRSGDAKGMWDESGNIGRQDNMGYTNAESWQFLDMYSRQAGAPSAEEQKRLMKFGRGYGLSTGEVSGLVGENVHSGGGQGSKFADAIAGSVAKSGMTPRIVEVMEANNVLLKSMNTTLKDGSSKQLLAYQTSLDKIGNEKGMTQLTGTNGANVISGLGGIFRPGEDNWKWMGIRALQQYNPKKYGKMNLFGLESTYEDGLIGKDGKPSDNVAAMSQYVKGQTGGNTDLQKRIMQKWLTDGGYAATKTQASQLWDSTNGLQNFSPDQLQKLQNGSVDSGASYDANRKNELGQGFLQTDSRFQAAMAQIGQPIVTEVQKLKEGVTGLMEDALKFMDDNGKVLSGILAFMNDHLVGLATAAGALAILQSVGALGGIGGVGGLLSTVMRFGIPLAVIAAGTVAMVEGFKFTDKFIKNGGFHPEDVARENYKAINGKDAPSWIKDMSQLDPANPSYYKNDPRYGETDVAKEQEKIHAMTQEQKKQELMDGNGFMPPQGTQDKGFSMWKDPAATSPWDKSWTPPTQDDKLEGFKGWLKNPKDPKSPTMHNTEEGKAPTLWEDVKRESSRFFSAWNNYIENGGKSTSDMSKHTKELKENGSTAFRSMEESTKGVFSNMLKSIDTFRVGATGIILAGMGFGGTGGTGGNGGIQMASLSYGSSKGSPSGVSFGGQADFVKKMLPYAEMSSQKTGLPSDFILGQWGHESGWGSSYTSKVNNNFAGIKPWKGKGAGNNPTYAGYDNLSDFASGYADFLQKNPRYSGLLGAANNGASSDRLAEIMGTTGYAEDPAYVSKLKGSIHGVDSTLSDKELFKPLQGAGTGDVKTASTKHESTVNVNLTGDGADKLTTLSKEQLIQLIKHTWTEQERQRKLTNPTKAVMA